jgi:hypothetical protein
MAFTRPPLGMIGDAATLAATLWENESTDNSYGLIKKVGVKRCTGNFSFFFLHLYEHSYGHIGKNSYNVNDRYTDLGNSR